MPSGDTAGVSVAAAFGNSMSSGALNCVIRALSLIRVAVTWSTRLPSVKICGFGVVPVGVGSLRRTIASLKVLPLQETDERPSDERSVSASPGPVWISAGGGSFAGVCGALAGDGVKMLKKLRVETGLEPPSLIRERIV